MTDVETSFNSVVKSVSLHETHEEDKVLPWFDHTKLNAICTCPTWGMFRYIGQKKIEGDSRAMALEAGIASHQVYAALRLLDMEDNQRLGKHFDVHGIRIFGEANWQTMLHMLTDNVSRSGTIAFCLQALYNSGFYDDPRDRRRTISTIEEACIAYIDRWPWGKYPVWIEDEQNPKGLIGIEIPLDTVIVFKTFNGEVIRYRYVGRADGLHVNGDHLELHENKTASRLNDAWISQMRMTHQVTGYCAGLSVKVRKTIDRARVIGMSIPLPRTYDYGGIVDEVVRREPYQVSSWMQWIWDTTRVYEKFKNIPDDATRFTHSCSRYFRPCSMIPYCHSDDQERAEIRKEMVSAEWHPLDEKSGD